MTLPELLISVALTGILIASLSMSITVIYRQSDNTSGRANNARSEQNVNIWMPADLASAESVSTDPAASPCAPNCPAGADVGGTNALMLTWKGTVPGSGGTSVPTETKVSYRYVLVGIEYQMIRVECTTVNGGLPTCEKNIVLHDLDAPPIGTPYIVGVTKPTWIMVVSQALDPGDTTGSTPAPVDDPTFKSKNGQRVVVTINGGGDVAGSGGGKNQISLSAGGTERKPDLATNSVSFNQTLTAARTRCGGNFGMVIDISGSINRADPTNMTTVRAAITSMIDTFAGTPVKLELTKFGWVGAVLGGVAPTGSRYFDMLKETDVSDLKVFVNGGTTSTGVVAQKIDSINDATNWEDSLYRAFRNSDGTIQASLPSKVIFFTDGIPSYDRLGGVAGQSGSTALPAGVSFPDDTGLQTPNGTGYFQRSWNRANRIAREFGVQVDYIGVFVGSDTTLSSNWTDVNAGYHLIDWLKWYHDVWEKGYHDDYQRANNLVFQQGFEYQRANNVQPQQGYHLDYQKASTVVFEKGYHATYQRNSKIVFEISNSGLAYEQWNGSSWSSRTQLQFLTNNTDPGELTDGWRARLTGGSLGSGGWTTITQDQYDKANINNNDSGNDGFRMRLNGSLSGTWNTVTLAEYLASNTTTDSSDGWQMISQSYTAPYDSWESVSENTYNTNNSTSASTDGWRTTYPGGGSWVGGYSLTSFNKSNITPSDSTDGWQIANVASSPYTLWQNTTQAIYDTNNVNNTATDGYQTIVTGASQTPWTSITLADYNKSNTLGDATTTNNSTDGFQWFVGSTTANTSWITSTEAAYDTGNVNSSSTDGWRTTYAGGAASWVGGYTLASYNKSNTTPGTDSTDGWRIAPSYTAPYSSWEASTQAAYNAGVGGNPSGWRTYRSYTAPFSSSEVSDEASYVAGKTAIDPTNNSDGWTATKVYVPPYTGYDATRTYSKTNRQILGDLIDPSGIVDPIKDAGGNVINAEVANMYTTTAWSDVQAALKAIALGQCGGTVTLQTRVGGTTPANDTFTYLNALDNTKVDTSGSKRSGTFDFAIPSGGSITAEIRQTQTSTLQDHYAPSSPAWTCKAGGVAITPTIVDVPGPWDTIRLTVGANQAVSCIQNVTFTP
ncbi:MAG: VWA domain-containing protein [Ilumatobacteraceae bacterium]|nr:VWA domain-containing protein [Ilumatobacteraceae bacterium]